MGAMTEDRAKLTADERNALPDSAFALPGRRYPIHDENHARAALSEVSQHGTAEEKAKVRAAVHKRYPHIGAESNAQHDPGFELRKRRRGNMGIGSAERRGMLLEVRAKPDGTGGTTFEFEGYGSVFDTPFQMWDKWGEPYTEIVKPGAFTRSLQRCDLDVPFLIGHDESRLALARTKNGTMQLSQDSHGLHVRAQLDGRRSDVRDLAYAVERGDMDEMSIGFVTRQHQWSEDYETRSMLDMDLHRGDVSPVALAAIPETAGSTVAFPAETLSRSVRAQPTTDAPTSDHMMAEVGPNHGDFTGAHIHEHDSHGSLHHMAHEHEHQGDHSHSHHATSVPENTIPDDRASGRPVERLGNPVDQDLGDGPDYNPDGRTASCSRATCPAGPNGSMSNVPDGKFCSYCGDALVRLNADGVPAMEEEQGAMASLAMRRKRYDLLVLAGHR